MKRITFAENSRLETIGYNALKTDNEIVIVVMPGMKFEIEKHTDDNPVVRVSNLSTMVGTRTLG